MTLRDRLRRLIRFGLFLAERLVPLAPLLTRMVLGYAFARTGLGKLQHFDDAVGFFADLGFPAPALAVGVVATLELVGGALLVIGLGTRLWAALLAVVMVVALATADRTRFLGAFAYDTYGPTDVVPFAILLFLLWLVAWGGGAISLDRLLGDGRSKAEAPATSPTLRPVPRAEPDAR